MSSTNLKGHLVHHGVSKEFVCRMCGREFSYKQQLYVHLAKAHNISRTTLPYDSQSVETSNGNLWAQCLSYVYKFHWI